MTPALVGIFGSGRNGSSLLLRLLDGIPGVYAHPSEVAFLTAMDDLATYGTVRRSTSQSAHTKPLRNPTRPISTELLLRCYEHHRLDMLASYVERLEGDADIDVQRSPFDMLDHAEYVSTDFVPAFLSAFDNWVSEAPPAKAYLFKSSEVGHLADYEATFPTMRFVHLFRNPLDVYDSVIRATRQAEDPARLPYWHLAGDNLLTIIGKRWVPHARFVQDRLSVERHYLIRYEDLVREPDAAIADLCAWLGYGMPRDPGTLTVLGGRSLSQLPDNVGMTGAATPKTVIENTKSHFHFSSAVFPPETSLILHLTRDYSKKLGYAETGEIPSWHTLIGQWVLPKRWEFLHMHGATGLCRALVSALRRRIAVLVCAWGQGEKPGVASRGARQR